MMESTSSLEELKEQYRTLKSRLAKQPIVDPADLADIIKRKVAKVRRTMIVPTVAGAMAIVLFPLLTPALGLSWTFCIATLLMVALFIGLNIFALRPLSQIYSRESSLLEMARKSATARRRLCCKEAVGLTLLLPWCAWFYLSILSADNVVLPPEEAKGIIIGALAGGIIGLAIGLWLFFRTFAQLRTLESQLKDYTASPA